MGFPYHFVDLTQDDVLARRHTLDKYGAIAQASAVALIIAVAIYQWIFNRKHAGSGLADGSSYARVPTADDTDPPGSEGVEMQSPALFADALKDEDLIPSQPLADDGDESNIPTASATTQQQHMHSSGGASLSANEPQTSPGRLSTWLDTPLRQGWKETRRHAVSVGIWSVWILSLVFRETGDDYLHVTKRFAQIAAALLPFQYLLGTSSRLSPLPFLFRTHPSSLYNPYHRMHALLIFVLLASHATWYMNFYFWAGKLPGRLFDIDVILGLSMATTFTIMAILARQAVRYDPKRRQWFVRSHLLATLIIPCMLFLHAAPGRWYTVEMLLIYVGVAYERLMRQREGATAIR